MSPCQKSNRHDTLLIFQDLIRNQYTEEDLSLAFFELANAATVGYRLYEEEEVELGGSETRGGENTTDSIGQSKKDLSTNTPIVVTVQQDVTACGNHTGGIVWETSYLLISYMLYTQNIRQSSWGRVLEVGAGCGLLGLTLFASNACDEVILTETEEVFTHLQANLERFSQQSKDTSTMQSLVSRPNMHRCQAQILDWRWKKKKLVSLNLASSSSRRQQQPYFDTIVGTDVIFSPTLVSPLLRTLRDVSNDQTIVYLCVQIRCEDSHRLFHRKASRYGWQLHDLSHELENIPQCSWGRQLECHLYQMTRITSVSKSASSSSSGGIADQLKGSKRDKGKKRNLPTCDHSNNERSSRETESKKVKST
jgi:Lysine methyltransferase